MLGKYQSSYVIGQAETLIVYVPLVVVVIVGLLIMYYYVVVGETEVIVTVEDVQGFVNETLNVKVPYLLSGAGRTPVTVIVYTVVVVTIGIALQSNLFKELSNVIALWLGL